MGPKPWHQAALDHERHMEERQEWESQPGRDRNRCFDLRCWTYILSAQPISDYSFPYSIKDLMPTCRQSQVDHSRPCRRRTGVGETMVASRAQNLDTPFWTKSEFHPEVFANVAPRKNGRRAVCVHTAMSEDSPSINTVLVCNDSPLNERTSRVSLASILLTSRSVVHAWFFWTHVCSFRDMTFAGREVAETC